MTNQAPQSAKREKLVSYLKTLQNSICAAFEKLETSSAMSNAKFEAKPWSYAKGSGGGEMRVIRGKVFEKAAVNWSGVSGEKFPMDDAVGPFFATGVSLITHMANPKMPTVHFNIRYLEAGEKSWFGGGFDLTPMGFPFEEDRAHFHAVAEKTLMPFGAELYPKFSQWAKEYYFIKHYNCERGQGGIFFDHFKTENFENDFAMWKSVGDHFLESIIPIYDRRIIESFSEADRMVQLKARSRYVEFNLLYDRGTKFGFQSGGNPEAILCSMPPLAAW